MKKSELRKLIRESIEEAITLKKYGDDHIVAVSDLEDPKERSKETFKNKDNLKRSGFRWDGAIGAWKIKADDFDRAQKTAQNLNKEYRIIKAFKDLEEFVEGDARMGKKEELAKKIDGYIENLLSDVENVRSSEEFLAFLAFNSKFRKYSVYNTILIWIQKRDATKVAGYHQWKKKFFRVVKKGATPISIYAPMSKKVEEEDLNGEIVEKRYQFFRPVTVFDISDTEAIDERGEIPPSLDWKGDDSPNEVADKLSQYAEDLADIMGVEVTHEDAMGGEGGWSSGGKINITKGNAGVFKARTFIHEIAHELLHQKEKSLFHIDESDREIRELQADSVAYIVLRHYDLPVQEMANYLAGWKADKDKIKANLGIIKKAADFIIDELDKIAETDYRNKPDYKEDNE
jgi:hypothetical protein